MIKAFSKGEKATYISSWDGKGTFSFAQVVVKSCGAKQMTLEHAESGKMLGREFAPVIGENRQIFGWGGTFKLLTDEEAEAKCLQLAAEYLITENAQIAARIERWGENPGYIKAMEKQRAELHAPCAIKR